MEFRPHPRVRILVSNDDGYRADGLKTLVEALASARRGHRRRARPQPQRREQFAHARRAAARAPSMASACITSTARPPTACTWRSRGCSTTRHDMVVSGHQRRRQPGRRRAVLGTVAAAIEGRFLGLPTMAVSLVVAPGPALRHGGAGGERARDAPDAHAAACVDDPERQRAGPALRAAARTPSDAARPSSSLRAGRAKARIRAVGRCTGSGPRAKARTRAKAPTFDAVANGFVSVTPLQVDLTRHSALADLDEWLRGRAP